MLAGSDPRWLARLVRTSRLPYVVLLFAATVALLGALAFRSTTRGRDDNRFQNAMQSSTDRIQSRLDGYVALLLATRAMIAAEGDVVHADRFHAFVEQLDLERRYPGAQGIGVSLRVPRSELASFEAATRESGTSDFRVWPTTGGEDVHAIVLLEPLDRRNRAAIGYDMSTEPVRHDAMARARDTGQPAASGPVTLVQEIDPEKQPGFLLYVPIYRGGRIPETVEERRSSLVGFVYSPFRTNDLLESIFGSEEHPRVAFEVRDAADSGTLLHRSAPSRAEASRTGRRELAVAGRTWALSFWTLPPFENSSSAWMWPWVVFAGAASTALLFAVSRSQARAAEELRIRGQVLDSMKEGVSVSDENGTILYTNRAEDEIFGYGRGELVGKPVTVQNASAPDQNERVVREVIVELRKNGIWSGEFDNVKKDGTPFVTAARISALEIAGHPYWVCVQEDVTAKKQQEKERAELLEREKSLRAEAEAASRTKDEFLAMLGHELRNPLAPIVTALKLLEQRRELRGSRELSIVNRQVAHLQRLVDDLLDVSALQKGKVTLRRRRVEIATVVQAAVEVVRPLIDERGHALRVDVPEGVCVDGDEPRLVQIFGNLLGNAAKYTRPGGHIEVVGVRDGEDVVVHVEDDGDGIPPETLERVFELFEQGERTVDRAQGGLGIGLAVVRTLVELHGGSVHGTSNGPGRGSTFVVRLKAADATDADATDAASDPRLAVASRRDGNGSGAAASLPQRRVLVVDDNIDAADLLAELMARAGHDVSVAHAGEQALELAAAREFDVAVLDIGLPGMDGYELASRLREKDPPVPHLIALTGYGQDRDRETTQKAGFHHHLVKPVDTKLLLDLVIR